MAMLHSKEGTAKKIRATSIDKPKDVAWFTIKDVSARLALSFSSGSIYNK